MDMNPAVSSRLSIWSVLLALILAACQANQSPIPASSQQYKGTGQDEFTVQWSGPAILHIEAGDGEQPFRASISTGLDVSQLVSRDGPIDEYRGYIFSTDNPARLSIQSDQAWDIAILPVPADEYPVLHIPGEYQGHGNAVILLEGDYGVATFNIDRVQRIEAWAFGPEGVSEKLYFKTEGDYKGKAVLPEGAGWLVVSAAGSWSVKILEPCCEIH